MTWRNKKKNVFNNFPFLYSLSSCSRGFLVKLFRFSAAIFFLLSLLLLFMNRPHSIDLSFSIFSTSSISVTCCTFFSLYFIVSRRLSINIYIAYTYTHFRSIDCTLLHQNKVKLSRCESFILMEGNRRSLTVFFSLFSFYTVRVNYWFV